MTEPAYVIRRLDTTDRAELRGWYETCTASVQVTRPGFVPRPFEEHIQQVLRPELGAERYDLVAVTPAGTVLGAIMVWLPMEDNLTKAWVITDVHPEHRRRGIGTALVQAAEAEIEDGRTEIAAATKTPPGDPGSHGYVAFARTVGYPVTGIDVLRRLPLPVAPALLDRLDTRARAEADGYVIETYVDGVPEAYRPSLGVLKGLIDVDAPTGELDWEPSPVSPEMYAEEVRRLVADGAHRVEAVAVWEGPDGSREVVGYSELETPSVPERPVFQEGTLVAAAHRGHRLGMAVKVAVLRALADLGVAWPAVTTGNEETNQWMIAINQALGFEVEGYEVVVTKRR